MLVAATAVLGGGVPIAY